MNTDHTSGPWKANFQKIAEVQAENGALIAKCNKLTSLVNLQANARLIAAAPELLDALETCLAFIEDAHILEGQWHWDPVEKARAAIAKAIGR